MSRVLKTKFPCQGCGDPCEVRSRRHSEFARCPRCTEKRRIAFAVHFADEKATKGREKARQEKASDRLRFAGLLRAAAHRLEAAAGCLDLAHLHTGREARRLVLCGRQRADWVRDYLTSLSPALAAIMREAGGLEVVAGLAEPPEGPREPPALRLVGMEPPKVLMVVRDEDNKG